jgi:hypothetical protein
MTGIKARAAAWSGLSAFGLAGLLLATAGCGSSSPPPWAAALGPSVTIVAPATVAAGNSSPGAVLQGLNAADTAKRYLSECPYVDPGAQAPCKKYFSTPSGGGGAYAKNTGIGYVAIDGDKALVGTTGTYCLPVLKPTCITNNDPAAIFETNKKPFGTLWTEQNKLSNNLTANVYTLAPCVEIGGKWYLNESALCGGRRRPTVDGTAGRRKVSPGDGAAGER